MHMICWSQNKKFFGCCKNGCSLLAAFSIYMFFRISPIIALQVDNPSVSIWVFSSHHNVPIKDLL